VAGVEYAAAHPDYVEPFLATAAGRLVAGAGFNPSTRYGESRKLDLFYGEVHGRRVMRVQLSGLHTSVVSSERFASGLVGAVSDVAFSPAGTLYVATSAAIYRIVPE
jgi:glucose/arabinose dehydrogenase